MENHEFFFIFENMEFNLYDVVRERQTAFLEEDIRNFMVQILQGLVYMHNNGYSTSNLMALLKLLILGWQEKFLPVLIILAMFPPDADFVFKNSLFLTGEYVSSNLTGLLSNEGIELHMCFCSRQLRHLICGLLVRFLLSFLLCLHFSLVKDQDQLLGDD